jgi:ribosome maturation factor RimP
MKFRDKILKLTNESLKENPSLFLIDLAISGNNVIKIHIDGDSGVKLNDCILISRFLEKNLDREENDFSLEVSSVGVERPLTLLGNLKKIKEEFWRS